MLAEIGHESPIEHASFTFAVEGVSRSLLAQLTRHRIASYSVQSQRYVKTSDFNYVIPPEIERDEKALERYNRIMSDIAKGYDELSEILYNKYIGEICPEERRYAISWIERDEAGEGVAKRISFSEITPTSFLSLSRTGRRCTFSFFMSSEASTTLASGPIVTGFLVILRSIIICIFTPQFLL